MKRYLLAGLAALFLGLSAPTAAEAGPLQSLWKLEQRKNAWLKRTFIRSDRGPVVWFRRMF